MKHKKRQTLKTKLLTFSTIVICLLSINCSNLFPKEKPEEIKKIRKHFLLSEFEEAKKLAVSYLEEHPKSPQGLIWRGKIAFILKEEQPLQYFRALDPLGKKAIPALIDHAADEDARVRVQVYFQMAKFKDPRNVETFLIRLEREFAEGPRDVLVTAMGMCGDPKVIPKLYSTLIFPGEFPDVKHAASLALANIATKDNIRDILQNLIEYYNKVPGLAAIYPSLEKTAQKIGKKYPQVLFDFIKNKPEPDPRRMDLADDAYLMISRAASSAGDEMTRLLINNYKKTDGYLKFHLLRIIGNSRGNALAEEFLIQELKANDPRLVRAALQGLNNFDSEAGNLAIGALLDNPDFQTTALRIISENLEIKPLEDKIVAFIDDPNYYNRINALRALRNINPQKHAQVFADKIMNDPRAPVVAMAISGLSKSANADYIELLTKKLNDPETAGFLKRQLIDSLRMDFMAQVTETERGVFDVTRHDLLDEDPLKNAPKEMIRPANHNSFR